MNTQGALKPHIDKLYKGRTELCLTLGTLRDGEAEILTLDRAGQPQEGPEPKYEVGSITKTFTAGLLAQGLDAGKLALEAPVNQYIEGLPKKAYYPTLRRLATHSSGLGAAPMTLLDALKPILKATKPGGFCVQNPFHGRVDEAVMRQTLADKTLQDKDYKYAYSNLGMGVLGYIAAGAQGGSYWQVMGRFVREELGLPNTGFDIAGAVEGYHKNINCGNWRWDESDVIAPAGALVSNGTDLLEWARLNLSGERPYLAVTHRQHGAGEKDFTMGLGWQRAKQRPLLWHGGNAGAFSAFLVLDTQRQTAAVALCNYGLLNLKALGIALLDTM